MGAYKYSQKQMEKAVVDFLTGQKSLSAVAKKHRIQYNAIYSYMKNHGIPTSFREPKQAASSIPSGVLKKAIAEVLANNSIASVARKYGISKNGLAYYVSKERKNLVSPRKERAPRPRVPLAKQKAIADYYLAGHSVQEVSAKFGVAMTSVTRFVRNCGGKVRSIGESQKLSWNNGDRKDRTNYIRGSYRLSEKQKKEIVDFFMPHTLLETSAKFNLPDSVIHRVVSNCFTTTKSERIQHMEEALAIGTEAYQTGLSSEKAASLAGIGTVTLRKHLLANGLMRKSRHQKNNPDEVESVKIRIHIADEQPQKVHGNRKFSDDDFARALSYREKGLSVEKAAEKVGMSRGALLRYMRKNHIPTNNRSKKPKAPTTGKQKKIVVSSVRRGLRPTAVAVAQKQVKAGMKKSYSAQEYARAVKAYRKGASIVAAAKVGGMSKSSFHEYIQKHNISRD